MPLFNEKFWQERADQGGTDPCWSGDRWLDWEHSTVVRRALKRLWPDDVDKVVDVGCGDGKWSKWMREQFGVFMVGTDMITYPNVLENLNNMFYRVDAEAVHGHPKLDAFQPELVVCLNSITCVQHWKTATYAMRRLSSKYVLVFDNFQTPTPPWWKDLPHRQPITMPEMIRDFEHSDWYPEKIVTGDVWHRRLFLNTPDWSHPAIAVLSAGLDAVAARTVDPIDARHQGILFKKG